MTRSEPASIIFTIMIYTLGDLNEQTLQVINWPWTCDRAFEFLAMACNKSFNIFYFRSFDISAKFSSNFPTAFTVNLDFCKLPDNISYVMLRLIFLLK